MLPEHPPAQDVNRALALQLFKAGQVSLVQAAKIALLSLEDFIDLLGQTEIPAVDYDPAELAQEIEASGGEKPVG